MKHPRPSVKVRAGVWPEAPHGTTYIEVTDPVNGATCIIELVHHFGSLKVQMHKPIGHVHLCSPVKCVWSSGNPMDMAELARSEYYRVYGRFPADPVQTAASAKECPDCGRCHDPDWGDTCAETEALVPEAAEPTPPPLPDARSKAVMAYVEGWNARRGGRVNLEGNPHHDDTPEATAWTKGFCRAAVSPAGAFLNPEKDGYPNPPITTA